MNIAAATAFALASLATPVDPIAVVPFRWTPGQIEVEVSINGGAPVWFIVDTGAEFSILDEELTSRLGLTSHPRSGRQFVRGVSLRLGKLAMQDQEVMIFALENFRRQKRAIEGVIGYDFFSRYVVSIDYAARTLVFHDPSTYRVQPLATSIPIAFAGRLATVPVTITLPETGQLDARVILDTGASQALILRHPFAESRGLLRRAAMHPSIRAGSLETTTVTFATLPANRITIGAFSFDNPRLLLHMRPTGAGGYTHTDGALGNEILRRFTATFDYSRKRLYLLPNPSFADPLP